MKREKHKKYWIVGLLVICYIGSVFAYWTQELIVHNEFETAKYETHLKEQFVSPNNWLPGQEINKDVWVTNKGTVPAFAKIVLQQEWVRSETVTDIDGSIISPEAGENFPLVFDSSNGKEYAAEIVWGNHVKLLASGRNSEIDLGIPVVKSIADAAGDWLMVDDQPDEMGNYTLYYIGVINQDAETPLVVDAVMMNPQIQPAVIGKNMYFDKATNTWIMRSERNSTYDYECAKYTLSVNATTVQATKDAVKEIFGTEKDQKDVVAYLAAHAIDPSEI